MGDPCKFLYVEHGTAGIGDGLAKQCLGVGTECLLDLFLAGFRGDKGALDAKFLQGHTKQIEGATVIAIDDKNVTIAQDENTIVVRFNNANDIKFEVEDVISLTGNIGCYNAPQIANPRDITVAGQMVSLPFYESFDTNDGKGGNDEEGWNGSIANNNIKYDNEGWEAKNVNGANQCAKAGSGSAGGSLTTPTLAFEAGKTYKLTFKAAAWDGNNEKTTLNISSTSGTLNKTSVEMEKGAWTEYTVYLTSATAAGTIKFSTSSANNRFFLDEVEIEESNVVPVTIGETGYATLYYSDKALDIPEDVRVSIVASVVVSRLRSWSKELFLPERVLCCRVLLVIMNSQCLMKTLMPPRTIC